MGQYIKSQIDTFYEDRHLLDQGINTILQDLNEIQQQFPYITYNIQSRHMVRFCIPARALFFEFKFLVPLLNRYLQ